MERGRLTSSDFSSRSVFGSKRGSCRAMTMNINARNETTPLQSFCSDLGLDSSWSSLESEELKAESTEKETDQDKDTSLRTK